VPGSGFVIKFEMVFNAGLFFCEAEANYTHARRLEARSARSHKKQKTNLLSMAFKFSAKTSHSAKQQQRSHNIGLPQLRVCN
jgi:hypothetical protein